MPQPHPLVRVVVPAAAGSSPVAHPSKRPAKRAFSRSWSAARELDGESAGIILRFHRGEIVEPVAINAMARPKRPNGAGSVYIKHGSFYGRWRTMDGGLANRKLGPVRRPGSCDGLTRTQAEKRLRELMDTVQVTTDPDRTVATAGEALLAHLEAKGCSRSHLQTVESHLRVHLVPFFKDRSLGRVHEAHVTRLLVHLRRIGRKPKTIRNVVSTLHSLFELALRRRWVTSNPCKLVDLPGVPTSGDIRYLTQVSR